MPGIAGVVTGMPRERAERQLSKMVGALHRESFYTVGTQTDHSMGVYIGWTAPSFLSCQMPLQNEKGDVVLVFSGEDFPEPDTVRRLKNERHAVEAGEFTHLIHLYEKDPSFPLILNGNFHGIVIDRKRGTVLLFNDRYGMHRLYYHESRDAFYFAAEPKAILAVNPELRRPDPRGLGEVVAYSCVLENRTVFKDVHILPAASVWTFRGGSVERKSTYFQPREWEEQDTLEPEPYYQELREVISRNLPRYFTGKAPVGLALTGGLDTRVIMALGRPLPNSLRCYTFGGMFNDCQDVQVARRVAQLCRQPHSVITVGQHFLSKFAHYAESSVSLTGGCVDIYRSSDLYVSEIAREIAPVKIVGTYGSEIIRQAVMFKPIAPVPGLFRSEFLTYIDQAKDTYLQARREHPVTFAAFRQSPWYHYGILALEGTQLTVRSPYLDNDFVRTVYRAPKFKNDANADVRLRLIQDGNPILAELRSDRGVGGSSGTLAAALMRGFLEFTFKAEYACDYGMPQWVARTSRPLAPFHLERLFLGRHKFLHFRLWYRDSLSEYVRQMLLDPLTLSRPYLERKGVESMVHGHLSGRHNFTLGIHKLLTLELLHRLFFDTQ